MRTLLLAVATLGLTIPAFAETQVFPLKYLTPAGVANMLSDDTKLMVPEGIESMTLELKKNSLTFSGTPEALEQMGNLLKLLDKPVRKVKVTLRIVQGQKQATTSTEAKNNKRCQISEPGRYDFTVMPHINGDDTVSLAIESPTEKAFRRITPGKPLSVAFKDCTVWLSVSVPDIPKE
ncbi:MAG: hypothetical protein QM758_16705 [Armatimonas sp.]